MKKFLIPLILFILSFFSLNTAFAENFYIENYKVNIDVTDDKILKITELIDTNFTIPSHGIYRDIPLVHSYIDNNGKKRTDYSKIDNIKCNNNCTIVSKQPGSIRIRFGDPNKKVKDRQNYILKYDFRMPADNEENMSTFYFNIIGTQWPVDINHVTFKITMPSEFPQGTETFFYTGSRGSEYFDNTLLKYNILKDKIYGYTKNKLYPEEGITVKVNFPENFFKFNMQEKIEKRNYTLIIAGCLAVLAFLIWLIFGKDEPVVPVVNFYPPKEYNSAEVDIIYNGHISEKALPSLLFYLAAKGYIEIEDDGISYTIKKLKEYEGKNKAEKKFLNALFKSTKDSIITRDELARSSTFFRYCQEIEKDLNKIKNKLFMQNACSIDKILLLLISLFGIVACIIYTLGDYSLAFVNISTIFISIFPIVGLSVVFSHCRNNIPLFSKIFIILWGVGFCGIPIFMLSKFMINPQSNIQAIALEVLLLCITIICFINLPKRSPQGRKLLGEILGLKKYIEVAERRRIEEMLFENPNYFSEMLPYAYIFGLENEWFKKVEGLMNIKPNWYKGDFSTKSLKTFSNNFYGSTRPSVLNGGVTRTSSRGGGSSGGGGGGGGGGSW